MEISVSTVIWVLVASALVYFMQAGFALCESGLTRAKNTGNILMKNMMDFCIGTPCFWFIGFGLMFGSAGPLIGRFDPFILIPLSGATMRERWFRRQCLCGVLSFSKRFSALQQRQSFRDQWQSVQTSKPTASIPQ